MAAMKFAVPKFQLTKIFSNKIFLIYSLHSHIVSPSHAFFINFDVNVVPQLNSSDAKSLLYKIQLDHISVIMSHNSGLIVGIAHAFCKNLNRTHT